MAYPLDRPKRWSQRFNQIIAIRDGDEFVRPGVSDLASEICNLEDRLVEAAAVLKAIVPLIEDTIKKIEESVTSL